MDHASLNTTKRSTDARLATERRPTDLGDFEKWYLCLYVGIWSDLYQVNWIQDGFCLCPVRVHDTKSTKSSTGDCSRHEGPLSIIHRTESDRFVHIVSP